MAAASQRAARERVFTATHGVSLEDGAGRWAHFKPAPERREPNGPEVFEFRTADQKTAARLLAVNDYGITEVTEDDGE